MQHLYSRGGGSIPGGRPRSSSLPGSVRGGPGGSSSFSYLAQSELVDVASPVPAGAFYLRAPRLAEIGGGGGGGASVVSSASAPTFFEDGRIARPLAFHALTDPDADPEATFSPRITARSARLAAKYAETPAPERLYRAAVAQHRRLERAAEAAPEVHLAGCTFFPSTDKSSVAVLRQQVAHEPGSRLLPAAAASATASPPSSQRAPAFSSRVLSSSSPASTPFPLQASPLHQQRSAVSRSVASSVREGGGGEGSVLSASPRGSYHMQSAVVVVAQPERPEDRPDLVRRVVPFAAVRDMNARHAKWLDQKRQALESLRRRAAEAELAGCTFSPLFVSGPPAGEAVSGAGNGGGAGSRRSSLPGARELASASAATPDGLTGAGQQPRWPGGSGSRPASQRSFGGRAQSVGGGSGSPRASFEAGGGSRAAELVLPRVPGDIEDFAERQVCSGTCAVAENCCVATCTPPHPRRCRSAPASFRGSDRRPASLTAPAGRGCRRSPSSSAC